MHLVKGLGKVARHIAALRSSLENSKFGCLRLPSQYVIIWSVGIWLLGTGELQAITENSVSPETFENWNSPPLELETDKEEEEDAYTKGQGHRDTSEDTETWREPDAENSSTGLSMPPPHPFTPSSQLDTTWYDDSSLELHYPAEPPMQIAGPENFNPGLRLPPSPPQLPAEPTPPPASTESDTSAIVLESLTTDFRRDVDNFDNQNQFIEETAQFRLPNGNRLRVRTGLNSFDQPDIESITNIPLQVGWEGKIDGVTVEVAGGVDLFDRLPTALNFRGRVEAPIALKVSPSGQLESGVVVSGIVEQGPYKVNAETLDNQITAWRFGPSVFWQIDRNTSFFSSLRLGDYNDGNEEFQSFSRLERKFGQFSVAANLFAWSYQQDLETESGYFSPPDFLVYSGELAWQGDVFDFLRCRLAATLGRQRLTGEIDNANSYQARCTAKLSPNVEADLGYGFSNIRSQDSEGSSYKSQSFTGQLRIRF